jgi:opacity protein-like surface antigen
MNKILQITAALIFTFTATSTASAQEEKYFSKVYLGGEVGYLDIEAQNNIAAGAFLGGRYQTNGDIVFGAELSVNGTLEEDTVGLVSIIGTIGTVTGNDKRNLFYVGAGYEGGFGADDGEGFFSTIEGFSIVGGFERAVHKNIALRLQAKYIDLGSAFDDDNVQVSVNGVSLTAGISFNF